MRGYAALTAAAFVLTSLLGVIHEAATRHVVCAAHGELMHADMPTTRVAEVLQHGSVARDLPASESHGHEHCALASALRQSRIAPRASVIAAPVATTHPVTTTLAPTARAVRIALYRTAPKTSPPA